jgi:hypothetical protein
MSISSPVLLKQVAKDARVAVYYVYGRMRRDGAANRRQ